MLLLGIETTYEIFCLILVIMHVFPNKVLILSSLSLASLTSSKRGESSNSLSVSDYESIEHIWKSLATNFCFNCWSERTANFFQLVDPYSFDSPIACYFMAGLTNLITFIYRFCYFIYIWGYCFIMVLEIYLW